MEYTEGRPCTILPTDMTPDQSGPAERELMARLVVCRRAEKILVSLTRNMSVMAKYFDRQRQISAVLGTGIQIGFHTWGGEMVATDIIPLSDF